MVKLGTFATPQLHQIGSIQYVTGGNNYQNNDEFPSRKLESKTKSSVIIRTAHIVTLRPQDNKCTTALAN
jgi:hypothetical protein